MRPAIRARFALAAVAAAAVVLLSVPGTRGQTGAQAPTNSAPNPYQTVDRWATLPDGRKWGSTSAVDIGPDGHIWVAERCGMNRCADRQENPIVEFDPSGKALRSFGAGMFVFPHGIHVDREGNVWVTDGEIMDGSMKAAGHVVYKFSPEGKLLMTLGKRGVPGTTRDLFNRPSDVITAPNGDIFVADGHGDESNARIVKFSKDGKYIKEWGKKGSAPGEFNVPHALAFDSRGRLLVGDRANGRIQVFDLEGKFIEQYTQFGRPSGIAMDRNDVAYVTDSESNSTNHAGWKRGIRVGSLRDEKIVAFIADPEPNPDSKSTSGAEGVAIDANGVIYAAEVGPMTLKKYVRK